MDLSIAKSQFYFKFNSKGIILKIQLLFPPAPEIHVALFQQIFHCICFYVSFLIFWIIAF